MNGSLAGAETSPPQAAAKATRDGGQQLAGTGGRRHDATDYTSAPLSFRSRDDFFEGGAPPDRATCLRRRPSDST